MISHSPSRNRVAYLSLVDDVVHISRLLAGKTRVDGGQVSNAFAFDFQQYVCLGYICIVGRQLDPGVLGHARQAIADQTGTRRFTAKVFLHVTTGGDHRFIVSSPYHFVGRILNDITHDIHRSVAVVGLPCIDGMEAEKGWAQKRGHDPSVVFSVHDIPARLNVGVESHSIHHVSLPQDLDASCRKDTGPDAQNHIVGAEKEGVEVSRFDGWPRNSCKDIRLARGSRGSENSVGCVPTQVEVIVKQIPSCRVEGGMSTRKGTSQLGVQNVLASDPYRLQGLRVDLLNLERPFHQ